MNDITKILIASSAALALALGLPGCGEASNPSAGGAHSADDGHDHAGDEGGHDHAEGQDGHDHAEGQDGHDHAEGEAGHEEHDDHEQVAMRSLGSVTIAGTTLAVSISGDIRPSSEVLLEVEVESGAVPAALRFWVGDEAGTGALKAKADAHDGHFHGQTEAPGDLAGASLWIEVEAADGSRQAAPVSLS
jgi:hypothetical protein